MTHGPGSSCIPSYRDGLNIIDRSPERVRVVLTRPRFRVNTNARWALKITKKYRVASSAMVLNMVGILSPCFSDFAAKKTITTNARESNLDIFGRVRAVVFGFGVSPTNRRRGRCLYTQPLRIYAGKIHTGGMRRGVSPGGVRLHKSRRGGRF